MVSRTVPLTRRIRAAKGQIVLISAWVGAALLAALLGLAQEASTGGIAVAVHRTHPVRVPESGRIATVTVAPGQTVRPGDVIATVDIPGLAHELVEADAEVDLARASSDDDAANMRRRFRKDLDDATSRILVSQVALDQARAEFAGFEAELSRRTAAGAGVTASEVDQVRYARERAAASVKAREEEQAALNAAERGARGRLAELRTEPGESALVAAEARVEALRARMAAATLRAHADGIVGPTLPVPGEWVEAGFPLVTITEQQASKAVVYLSVAQAHRLISGDPVRVQPESGRAADAIVQNIGLTVEVVPVRHLRDPTVPEWGVPVTLQVTDRALVPGEVLGVEF